MKVYDRDLKTAYVYITISKDRRHVTVKTYPGVTVKSISIIVEHVTKTSFAIHRYTHTGTITWSEPVTSVVVTGDACGSPTSTVTPKADTDPDGVTPITSTAIGLTYKLPHGWREFTSLDIYYDPSFYTYSPKPIQSGYPVPGVICIGPSSAKSTRARCAIEIDHTPYRNAPTPAFSLTNRQGWSHGTGVVCESPESGPHDYAKITSRNKAGKVGINKVRATTWKTHCTDVDHGVTETKTLYAVPALKTLVLAEGSAAEKAARTIVGSLKHPSVTAQPSGTVVTSFCGTDTDYGYDSSTVNVTLTSATVTCATALRVVNDYSNVPPDQLQGSSGAATVDGWSCASTTVGDAAQTGQLGECDEGPINRISIDTSSS